MNKENFVIVTTLDGDGGVLTPLSVLAAALLALPDLATFPEVLGGLRLFPSQQQPCWSCWTWQPFRRFWGAYAFSVPAAALLVLPEYLAAFPEVLASSPAMCLGKFFCVSLDWLKHHLSTLIYR